MRRARRFFSRLREYQRRMRINPEEQYWDGQFQALTNAMEGIADGHGLTELSPEHRLVVIRYLEWWREDSLK